MSASHNSFGPAAVKRRPTRSGAGAAAGSGIVVRRRFPRRETPSSSSWRIKRATRFRPTRMPCASRSSACTRGGYGYSKSHSRWFWGMRLHLACSPDGTPRAAALVAADRPEREVALTLLPRALAGGETIVCDKGYAGRDFAEAVGALGAAVLRPP